MKITIKLDNIEMTIENFQPSEKFNADMREGYMKDTLIPTLTAATEKIKELYKLKNK